MATSSSWTSKPSCPTQVGAGPTPGGQRGNTGTRGPEIPLPAEPSADLIMNVSRCRRLIVVLSVAYLEQDWCNSSFR